LGSTIRSLIAVCRADSSSGPAARTNARVKAAWNARKTATSTREPGASEYPTITHVRATSMIAGP
jgi:hypothetical protein